MDPRELFKMFFDGFLKPLAAVVPVTWKERYTRRTSRSILEEDVANGYTLIEQDKCAGLSFAKRLVDRYPWSVEAHKLWSYAQRINDQKNLLVLLVALLLAGGVMSSMMPSDIQQNLRAQWLGAFVLLPILLRRGLSTAGRH